MKCCWIWSDIMTIFTTIHFYFNMNWAQYAIVLHYNRLEMLARDKHSSLLGPLVTKNTARWFCNQWVGLYCIKFVGSIVKIRLIYSSDTVFQLQVIGKSYRQVLTLINNSQLLLKLEILDKFILVTFHNTHNTKKVQHYNWLIPVHE